MFRPPTDSDGTVPIEFVDFVDTGSTTDVDFGGRGPHAGDVNAVRKPMRPQRQRRAGWSTRSKYAVVAGAGVLLVVAFVVGANDDPHSAVVTGPSKPASLAEANGSKGSTRALGAILMNDQHWGLFLADPDSGRRVVRLDLATGVIAALPEATYSQTLGVSGTGLAAHVVAPTDVGGADAKTAGPDGATWLAGIDGSTTKLSLVRMQASSGLALLANYDLGALASVFQRMIGSMANGEPVFAAPDGSAFVFNPTTKTRYRLANGTMVSPVVNGNYGDVECDPAGRCQLLIHGASHTYSMPYSAHASFSISPDGGHAYIAVSTDGRTERSMVNVRTGVAHTVREPPSSDGGSTGDTAAGAAAAWAPDGMTAFFVDGTQLTKVSSDGMWTQQIDLPAPVSPNAVAVAVA